MKLEVNITKRYFFILLVSIFLVGTGIFVYAYNSAFSYPTSQAAVAGHSADEVVVKMNDGTLSTVQNLLKGTNTPTTTTYTAQQNTVIMGKHKFCFLSGYSLYDSTTSGGGGLMICKVDYIAASDIWQIWANTASGGSLQCLATCID